ncbi:MULTISPECIES: hypothetical protein [unclassified Acinetobacter]|uniref:hypothetical protein n=1 Tax=unclassified Acinetobacter TaxID=196816 RepID=UPI0012137691|nr:MULTISPECIES: hypothetical protein [unclassified Acinetobacter]RZJ20960.1 MAG: hypothetical protein EON51_13085 [Acinetobacter sp.]
MYQYQTQDNFDQEIDFILRFLFEYDTPEQKQGSFNQAYAFLQRLDIASHYLLFSLVKERLPRRAKLLFAAEDYQGKKEVIEEVMQHWLRPNTSLYVA